MEALVALVAPLVPTAAWPIIIVVLGCAFIYYKIKSERKATKSERDKDSQDLHDSMLKHDFEISRLKGDIEHQHNLNADLSNQINILSQSVAKFSVAVDMLSESVKEIREDLRR